MQKEELTQIIRAVQRSVLTSRSPSKAIKTILKRLQAFFARNEVRGNLYVINQRHIHFRLAFPVNSEDKLTFFLLDGVVNARTGATKMDYRSPIQLSLHALQRLFERLGDGSEAAVLNEIYSCLGHATHWHVGGVEANAKCWPLVSTNGFFVATNHTESSMTAVVTWIRDAGSGRKWGMPLQNLLLIKEKIPSKLENAEFAREFIRSFPWMRYEHAPADDYFMLAVEQRDQEMALLDESGRDVENGKFDEIDLDIKPSVKLSASYIPGFNYENSLPPFRPHTIHRGLVVQIHADGTIVVGLNNGWVGKIPKKSITRGYELIPGYVPPKIGDEINVVVHKIQYFSTEGACSISLDPKDVSDANWFDIERNNPVGTIATAKILEKYKDEFVMQTSSGLRGIISANEIHAYLQHNGYLDSVVGLKIEVRVVGFKPEKKCLILSLPEGALPNSHELPVFLSVGDQVRGKCIERQAYLARIELPFGHIGVLQIFNNWGRELPNVGSEVDLTVFHVDLQRDNFLLAAEPPDGLERVFSPALGTPDRWSEFAERYRKGDYLEVQNIFWAEYWQCYVVNTGFEICAMLSPNEVDWLVDDRELQKKLLKPGDIFNVVIQRLDPNKRKFSISKKAFEKYLSDEKIAMLHIGQAHEGVVVSTKDYGYFVWLPEMKIQGLLHASRISDGQSFEVGDPIRIVIEKIDHESRRVSFVSADFLKENSARSLISST